MTETIEQRLARIEKFIWGSETPQQWEARRPNFAATGDKFSATVKT